MAELHSFFVPRVDDFTGLKMNNDTIFFPVWDDYISERWPIFRNKWKHILTEDQLIFGEKIVRDFGCIQKSLSEGMLTLIHGDVKSPNIFYKNSEDYEPYFIDWQYIAKGKGVQDLVFFMIESFDSDFIQAQFGEFKEHYYSVFVSREPTYSIAEFEADFRNAAFYFPFFVAVWFGTLNQEDLIDVEFPLKYITRLFRFYSLMK
jgi:hypothetical protein